MGPYSFRGTPPIAIIYAVPEFIWEISENNHLGRNKCVV